MARIEVPAERFGRAYAGEPREETLATQREKTFRDRARTRCAERGAAGTGRAFHRSRSQIHQPTGSQAMCERRTTESAYESSGAQGSGPTRLCRPAEARRAVERAVAERCRMTHTSCDPQALGDAVLVASELTSNAILHGGGVTDFHVDVAGPCLCVSVSDRSDEVPVARPRSTPTGGTGWAAAAGPSCAGSPVTCACPSCRPAASASPPWSR